MIREDLIDDIELRLDTLDDTYAKELEAGLSALLAAGLLTAHPAIGRLCLELLDLLRSQGAAGLWAVTATNYPAFSRPTPAQQAMYDALVLRLASPAFEDLAALLAYHGEADAEDYPREVVATALIDAANPRRNAGMDDQLDAIEVLRMEVPNSPARAAQESRTYYEVVEGDHLEDVAFGVLGDRDAWPALVQLYGLVPPYLSDFGGDGVLRPGERLMLPAGQEAALRLGGGLGKTFKLSSEDGQRLDLSLTGAGDLALIGGLDGFASDIALRALTPLGDVPAEPSYGVPMIAGESATEEGLAHALLLNDSLYGDSRVGRVISRAKAGTSARLGVVVDQVVVLPRPNIVEGL